MKELIIEFLKTWAIKPVYFLMAQAVLLAALYVLRNSADFGFAVSIPVGYITAMEWLVSILQGLLSAKVYVESKGS